MVRLMMYECKATKGPEGQRTEYQAGLVYNVDDAVAAEWMVGKPPHAWPCGEERPAEWPVELDEVDEVDDADMSDVPINDEAGAELADDDY